MLISVLDRNLYTIVQPSSFKNEGTEGQIIYVNLLKFTMLYEKIYILGGKYVSSYETLKLSFCM